MAEQFSDGNGNKVPWRDYVDMRIIALETATNVAKEGMERRLETMNEFREALKNQQGTFVTRAELERILEDIRLLRESKASLEGKASQQSVNFNLCLSVLAVITALFSFLFKLTGK